VPDIQVHAGASTFWDDGRGHSDRPGAGGTVTLLAPESRGRVSLRSAEPTDQPEIDFRFYEHRADLDTLVTGLEMLFDIAARKPLAPYLTEPLLLGTSTPDRARLAEHALRYTQTLYHPVGTCAMGAVVDPRLRVRGVDRLRVVDASVMPAVVRGNTNAPTVMIAEKAADLLR
jgi:choline dehydrogenase